ncbi:hypothetical protein SAY87_031841 [Trapa incisa]|uniref:Alpha 1,4-glycosyltransferase domain-containing protein n=1 Tax=Trapa incisa TaxID=236973 RepID=A0AAN7KRU4_9MYRT|nr:hypothetical protein SAY87_031841 [Trapa incisa]
MHSCRALLLRAKRPIYSVVAVVALCFVLYYDWIISHDILGSLGFVSGDLEAGPMVQPNLGGFYLRSVQEVSAIEELDSPEMLSPLLPPINVTEEERIAWFKEHLQEFDIFRNDNRTNEFHARVTYFLGSGCDLSVFMTWILPATLFGRRELLALECLFRANPNGCLVILSRSLDSSRGLAILEPILSRGFKLLAVTPSLDLLLEKTPAMTWYHEIKNGSRDPGEIPLAQNLSNLLRLAVLYKYGGVYIDTDFIAIKEFIGLRNSIGAQSINPETGKWTRINNAVMAFDRGHPLLFKFMEEFGITFNGNKWGHNGPYLVSRVIARLKNRLGYNFTVLPPMAFYPVDWTKIGGLFKKPDNGDERRWVEAKLLQLSETTYGVHLWNKQSKGMEIEKESVMDRLISKNCLLCRDAQ